MNSNIFFISKLEGRWITKLNYGILSVCTQIKYRFFGGKLITDA